MWTKADKGGGRVNFGWYFADVIYGWPLTDCQVNWRGFVSQGLHVSLLNPTRVIHHCLGSCQSDCLPRHWAACLRWTGSAGSVQSFISNFSISSHSEPVVQYSESVPIFMYGYEVWSVTCLLSKKIDALDNWCLRRILRIHWKDFVSNDEVRSRTEQTFLSDTVCRRRLSFFGHLSCANPSQDHSKTMRIKTTCIEGR